MKRLVFKPEFTCVMIQYREGKKVQDFKLSIDAMSDMGSSYHFSNKLFEILDVLGVPSEFMQQVDKIINDEMAYPNHIFSDKSVRNIMQKLSQISMTVQDD